MKSKGTYDLKDSFKSSDDSEKLELYANLLDEYNELVKITDAFIRMAKALPNY
jgi:enolase